MDRRTREGSSREGGGMSQDKDLKVECPACGGDGLDRPNGAYTCHLCEGEGSINDR